MFFLGRVLIIFFSHNKSVSATASRTEAVFSSQKDLDFGIVVYFVVIWQLISNHKLIRLKRFILYEIVSVISYFLTIFNISYMCLKIWCNRYCRIFFWTKTWEEFFINKKTWPELLFGGTSDIWCLGVSCTDALSPYRLVAKNRRLFCLALPPF